MEKVLRKLQSGSDIRGIAIQHEDKQVTLNRETVAALAQGYVNYISKKLGKNPEEIAVSAGTDPRITGGKLQCAFIEELLDAGMTVYDFGLSTTPSMFMSTIFEKYNSLGGILVHGIPEFRLNTKVVEESIKNILDLGVDVKYNKELGKDFKL